MLNLLSKLELSSIQEIYKNNIKQYEKCNLLIINEWILVNTNNIEQQDILKTLEDRYRIHSMILCSQFNVERWHSKLDGGTLQTLHLDRIVQRSHTIKILGNQSMGSR